MDSLERLLIRTELTQRREEGLRRIGIGAEGGKTRWRTKPPDEAVFQSLYDQLDALEPDASFPYEEPSDLEPIRALRPDGPRLHGRHGHAGSA